MMEVYDLFRGKVPPEAVLQRLEISSRVETEATAREQRFNAHLYLALYFDSVDKPTELSIFGKDVVKGIFADQERDIVDFGHRFHARSKIHVI